MISSIIRSGNAPASRLSVRATRNKRMIGKILTILVLCVALIPPVPKFSRTPAIVVTGETVFFDGSTSSDPDGVIVDYVWEFGEGSPQRGIGVLHTYSSPGVYEVSLSVTDDSGVTVIMPMAVWVHPALALTASSNATQGLAPVGLSFSTQVSGGQSP